MNAVDNFKDVISLKLFGRSRTLAVAGGLCVSCGKPATDFRDDLSRKEFDISGLCQVCQGNFFVESD